MIFKKNTIGDFNMYFENDKNSVSFLYHLVTSKTKAVHESMVCEDWWVKHKEEIFFPKPEYIKNEWDKEDKDFFYKRARLLLNTNRSLDFFMYILTDYEKESDFILTLRRQEFWLMGFLVSSATWKREGRDTWFPKISIHLVELDKEENPHLFHYWDIKYRNSFTNLKLIRKAKNNG